VRPGEIELYDRALDDLVQVINGAQRVVVRMAHDHASGPSKAAFIRHLASEGFIPDRYQWFLDGPGCDALPVDWLVDDSWVTLNHRWNLYSIRLLHYLTRGRLFALGLFLAALATAIWVKRH